MNKERVERSGTKQQVQHSNSQHPATVHGAHCTRLLPSILRFFIASKRGVRSWDLHGRYFKKASAIPLPLSPHTIFAL